MKTTDFDRIASSAPLNTDAAKTYGMTGTGDLEYHTRARQHWDAPPKTMPVPKGTEDRTGTKFGKFRVVGLLGSKNAKGSLWLVRCLCGQYESRRSRSIGREVNANDCCTRCRRIETAKRKYERQQYFDRHGHWPHEAPSS